MNFFLQIKKVIPPRTLKVVLAPYHYALAFLGALYYRSPSKSIVVIGVTGTKGKTTVVELLGAMLQSNGHAVALSNSLRYKCGGTTEKNMSGMTMPGRFFLQKFFRNAIRSGCTYAIIEMTSEGVSQYRHKWIELDTLIFTNLEPEHIESHGSFEAYKESKRELGRSLEHSTKGRKSIIANKDDEEGEFFLSLKVEKSVPYSLKDAAPYLLHKNGIELTFEGVPATSSLTGEFNVYNILAAAMCAKECGVPAKTIARALSSFGGVPGRMEYVEASVFEGNQPFDVVVDYAHTPGSLASVYSSLGNKRKICVLGSAGGGRDQWKREVLGEVIARNCDRAVLTSEDPYDEDDRVIISAIQEGISKVRFSVSHGELTRMRLSNSHIVFDRRKAIRKAYSIAERGDVVVLTGKGSEPYMHIANGKKIPWDEREVALEELERLFVSGPSSKV
jgi:UDP-N-acetylmuramoyl-L-alanyl-D-glutamate--2,6-diaminopimelate ligase